MKACQKHTDISMWISTTEWSLLSSKRVWMPWESLTKWIKSTRCSNTWIGATRATFLTLTFVRWLKSEDDTLTCSTIPLNRKSTMRPRKTKIGCTLILMTLTLSISKKCQKLSELLIFPKITWRQRKLQLWGRQRFRSQNGCNRTRNSVLENHLGSLHPIELMTRSTMCTSEKASKPT